MITVEDLSSYTDTELEDALNLIVDERARRYAIAEAPRQVQEALDRYQEATGLKHSPGEEWVLPDDPMSGYNIGDTVQHNGKGWESLIPNNFTEPGNPADPQAYRWWKDLSEADEVTGLLPWDGNGKVYLVGDTFTYEGATYTVIQTHTSQPDWRPDTVPALYQKA